MREFLSRHLFSPLQGMTYTTWRSLLRQNGHVVDLPYRPRAAFQTAVSLSNQVLASLEERIYGSRIDAAEIASPLFILGHFRSGTTHLHNLLALDPQFSYPTLYQTLYPRTFLTTERVVPRLGRILLMRRRPHDNVPLEFGSPSEDELAICADSGVSPYLSWVFPAREEFYDRFLTLRESTIEEAAAWRLSLRRFLKKISLGHARPIVLKSPPHTARIAQLIELFPGARFVHIYRNPYEVFRSANHMYTTTMRYWLLQRPRSTNYDERILALYRTMYDVYFDQKASIPQGRLCEIAYEALVRDPIASLETIYRSLGLPGFDSFRTIADDYLRTIADYRTNRHVELPEAIRRRVAHEWRRSFEEWGYRP